MKIRCTTLFDITKTGVGRRQSATKEAFINENKCRSQQINFETLIQIVSMRCQPENITDPRRVTTELHDNRWGIKYHSTQNAAWEFTFTTYHRDVFSNEISKLGNLLSDSEGVPMLTKLDETQALISRLITHGDYKNIHYEIVEDDNEY